MAAEFPHAESSSGLQLGPARQKNPGDVDGRQPYVDPVTLGFAQLNARFDKMDRRVDNLERRPTPQAEGHERDWDEADHANNDSAPFCPEGSDANDLGNGCCRTPIPKESEARVAAAHNRVVQLTCVQIIANVLILVLMLMATIAAAFKDFKETLTCPTDVKVGASFFADE
ncbi:hypothetical protein SASPL_120506 [Salvia splendens]|uniref:Uncharacterized protein n=1 Tax=Salvia splendens TaxID=180675 RepID=A0A8X8ZVC3_SALSN|nr:hypothetical protein SASPL_120506 [Salvia splendens]